VRVPKIIEIGLFLTVIPKIKSGRFLGIQCSRL